MKHFKVALLALLLITSFSKINAQDENNPWAIGFGVNMVDFYPTNSGISGHGSWFDKFVNIRDHFNMSSSVSKITVSKYMTDGFSLEIGGTLNQITNVGDNQVSGLSYFSLDGTVKYDLNKAFGETSSFDPYALVGGGYTWLEELGTGTFNGGLGFNYWVTEKFGFNLESKYKHSFESGIVQHFQHSLGIVVKFGGSDEN